MICVPLVLLYWFAGRFLVYIFMKDITGEAIDTGVLFLRIVSPFYFAVALKLTADGVLRGAGLMGRFMVATFTDLILRVVLAVALAVPLDSMGIWCAWPVGWIVGMVISVVFYRSGPWKNATVDCGSLGDDPEKSSLEKG